MNERARYLSARRSARALDLATGGGGFLRFLLDNLGSRGEAVGLDDAERAEAAFSRAFEGETGVRFQRADAARLPFPDSSFDLVSISNSLHHFGEPREPLREAIRVLSPGGLLVVNEMYRDAPSGPQANHVLLHDWWSAVDRARGVLHRETFARREIAGLVASLGLSPIEEIEDEIPGAPELASAEEIESAIDRYLDLARDWPKKKK